MRNTKMSVDGGVPRSASQPLAFSILNMLSFGTHKLLGQSEINYKDSMSISSSA